MTPVEFRKLLLAESLTHPGLVRKTNEDSLGFFLESGCFFVADGMGGGSAGDIASSLLENQISDAIEFSGGESPEVRKNKIHTAIHDAHLKIREYAETRSFAQMGTTLALMLFNPWNPRRADLCHIGDSRIYRLRNNSLNVLTRDHTVGAELEREMMSSDHPEKGIGDHRTSVFSHVLTRVVGATSNEPEAEWSETEVRSRDRFLICSDGVTTMLAEPEIQKIISESGRPDEAVRALSESVLKAGAKDNYSIIIIFVGDLGLPKSDPEETAFY
ncbi:MAG: serine/threonine-protein phosphatase [Lentisphaeria bacterium]|nr:serine/threonine-protein phosphatase [Lentisphaeria bacterium]